VSTGVIAASSCPGQLRYGHRPGADLLFAFLPPLLVDSAYRFDAC
jgi:hypothetical protein